MVRHWASSIRATVKVHPDFTDIDHPGRIERADFEYSEVDDLLGGIVIELAHNDEQLRQILSSQGAAQGGKIEYLVEVKTTTGPCSNPFFMSRKQYQLVRKPTSLLFSPS
jgi:hypothetical protein